MQILAAVYFVNSRNKTTLSIKGHLLTHNRHITLKKTSGYPGTDVLYILGLQSIFAKQDNIRYVSDTKGR